MVRALRRFLENLKEVGRPVNLVNDRTLPWSWVLTNRLAIGPMPRKLKHWQQLQEAGFQSSFSCCYPEEDCDLIQPEGWISDRVSLPDHRNQEPMKEENLALALLRAEQLLYQSPPLYLHCMAGYERSPLLAVGLTARVRGIDLFAALAWVRRSHPTAMPIYPHLVMLEAVLADLPPGLEIKKTADANKRRQGRPNII